MSGSARNLSYEATRTHRACAQVLSELRRMIDRGRTPDRSNIATGRKKSRQLCILGNAQSEIRQHDCACMRRTRAMRARRLIVVRRRLRSLPITMATHRVSDGISREIASECEQRKNCENTQKCFAAE